jgi:hypothetical protein
MIKSTINFLIILALISGCRNSDVNNTIIQRKIDSDKWKNDTLGCKGDRLSILDSVTNNKSLIEKLNKDEIERIFGNPNINKNNSYRYFLEQGVQCLYVNNLGYDSVEVYSLIIDFNIINKVDDVRLVVP